LREPGRIAEVPAVQKPADFENEVNRTFYGAMLRLHSAGTPIDITLVVGELHDRGKYVAARALDWFFYDRLLIPRRLSSSLHAAMNSPALNGNWRPYVCDDFAFKSCAASSIDPPLAGFDALAKSAVCPLANRAR
jgi:hypothetical protein